MPGPSTTRLSGQVWRRSFVVEAEPATLQRLIPELPHGWQPLAESEPAERAWCIRTMPTGESTVEVDGHLLAVGASPSALVRAVAGDIELWAAEQAHERVIVHSGVVACDGRAMLLPGHSRSGKSTLVAALIRAGAQYYSDEYAPLDPLGRVHAYPRRPRLRADSPAAQWDLIPSAPPGPPPTPLPVALVAALDFRPQATTRIDPISPAAALVVLLENTVCAASRPGEAFATVEAAVAEAHGVRGTRGEAEPVAAMLLELLRNTPLSRASLAHTADAATPPIGPTSLSCPVLP